MEKREHDEEGPPFALASDWVRKHAARCMLHVRCTLAVPSFFQLFIILFYFILLYFIIFYYILLYFIIFYYIYFLNPQATAAPAWMHTVLTVVVQPRQRSTVHLFHLPELRYLPTRPTLPLL
jgi:hypothetical protein